MIQVNKHRVVILDMDGTFLDSRGAGAVAHEWAYDAFEKTLGYYGLTLSIEEIDRLFLTPLHTDGEEGVREFCNRFDLDCNEFWTRREKDVIEAKIETMRGGEITLCKDSVAVIKYLSGRYYLAVVSDSQQACVDFALQHFKLRPYFKIWYGRKSDLVALKNRKPNPYYVNKVLAELNMQREDAILVDDSPVGILAAKSAGIDSVLIMHEEQSDCEPTFLVKHIGELREVL